MNKPHVHFLKIKVTNSESNLVKFMFIDNSTVIPRGLLARQKSKKKTLGPRYSRKAS